MSQPRDHISKARESLGAGRHLLCGGFTNPAGREAYMAAFHAALAIIQSRTGRQPKTHNGTHTEFARLSRSQPSIQTSMVAFLSRAYEFKSLADYMFEAPMTPAQAQSALDEAEQFVAAVCALLAVPETGG